MKSLIIIMSFFTFIFGNSNAQHSDFITLLDKPSFKLAITSKKVQLVDVRTPNEYKGGHIKNAININFFNHNNFISSFNKLDKEKPIYLYCRSGNRSKKAARKLDSFGFKKIFDLKGGYLSWK